MKLIKINQDHYVVVDDSEIKEGDWCTTHLNIIDVGKIHNSYTLFNPQSQEHLDMLKSCKKITHSTEPESFGDGWMQSIKPLLLSEVKELLGEVDVDKKAEEFAKHHSIYDSAQDDTEYGYREGYNQCLEDNKEKKYTEEDLIKFADWVETSQEASEYDKKNRMRFDLKMEGNPESKKRLPELFNIYIQTLKPKVEWEVAFENGKLKLI